jgi:hypothetical protein
MAVCGVGGCPNVLISSEAPPSWGQKPYSPELLGWITMHELGHALGLGHATNLLESTDLMGLAGRDLGDPVLSDCDLDALAFVSRGRLRGVTPTRQRRAPTPARSTAADRLRFQTARPDCCRGWSVDASVDPLFLADRRPVAARAPATAGS